MKRLVVFLTMSLAGAAACAGTPIDKTLDVPAHVTVSIQNIKGEVNVTGWNRNQVRITGTLGKGALPLRVEQHGDSVHIEVKAAGRKGWFNWRSDDDMDPTTLHVQVPLAASLDVDTVSAATRVRSLSGGTLAAKSVSGRVQVDADSPRAQVQTVSGDVRLAGAFDRVQVQTVSGDIQAGKVHRNAELQTVSGHVRLMGGPFVEASLNSVSGDIEVSGSLQANGRMRADSVSGDVLLALPSATSALLHVASFSGSIRSAFGGQVQDNRRGPGSSLGDTLGSGNGRIEVQTFSGDVSLRRADAQ